MTLDGVAIALGGISYQIPRLQVRGSTLSRDDLTRLFDPASAEPVAERVRRLNASEIVAPEVTSQTTTPQGEQVVVYRDVVFRDVRQGRIGSVTAAGGTLQSKVDGKVARGEFGLFELKDTDLGLAISLFTPATPGISLLKRIYGSFSLEGLSVLDPSGVSTRIGRLQGRDLSAKPTSAGWLGTMEILGKTGDLTNAPPAERGQRLAALAELLDAFSFGDMEATAISFGAPGQEGGRIDRVAFTGGTASSGAEFRLEGLDVGTHDGRVHFGALTFGGVSLQPMLAGMREIASSQDEKLSPADIRRLIPRIGLVRLDGLEVDVPGPAPAGGMGQPQRTRVSLGQVEIKADNPISGVPSDIRFALRDAAFTVPPNSRDSTLIKLSELGYERVAGSFAAAVGWNEPGREMLVRELSLDGSGMGNVTVRAVLGNASRDLFNPDSAIASVAALAMTAKSLEITVANQGLFERIVAREAKRQQRAPDDVRREYGIAAAMGIPAMLGNSPSAKTIAQAVARFVAKPGRLSISARARQPAGFGVSDFMSGPDPASVLNALEVTATAD